MKRSREVLGVIESFRLAEEKIFTGAD